MDNGYTLSDIGAVAGGGMGYGGGSLWIVLILIFLLGGGAWNRGDGYGQFATAASQQEILFGQQFQNIDNKIDRLANGLCDSTYSLNNTIVTEGRAGQNATNQVRFDMANYNAGIMAAITADGEKTRGMIAQNKIEALQEKVRSLELAQATNGVVRYPNGFVYSAGNNPFCGCGNSCC